MAVEGMAVGKGKTVEQLEEARVVIEERMIENPMMTDGLIDAALEAGVEQPRWAPVIVNKVTTVGGLARMKGLSEAQLASAGRYRALTEIAMISGAKAIDYEAVRVDTSGGGRDVGIDGAAARRELLIVRRRIGPFQASLLDRIICDEMSVRDLVSGGQARLLTSKRVRVALDDLVTAFDRARRGVRAEGEVAGDWSRPVDDGSAKSDKAH